MAIEQEPVTLLRLATEGFAMLKDFKAFLLQTNAFALAIGVIIGAAIGKVVGSLASDILMPLIGTILPGGAWREQKIVLSMKPDGTP
ncbi:MAG TPA: MscL family protein, partial [Candidatus Limnocylindria bacterium]|nr:MscL family protein [Candidatus Limnocylindria bacterium]